MFQTESLMPWRTALRTSTAGLEFRGVADAGAQADEWLKRVGLGGFGDRYPHQLSGGMRKRVSLAQTLVLDPDIILMDEPFSALDVQTRQLMENEVLALWAAKKKAVLFITHDLDEAIAMSDRVVVLSAGPASHPIGEFAIDLARPRDVAEVRVTPRFVELHQAIWEVLRDEVLKGYAAAEARRCMWSVIRPSQKTLRLWQVVAAGRGVRRSGTLLTTPGLIPPFMFENDRQAAFFFGEPLKIFGSHLDLVRHQSPTSTSTCGSRCSRPCSRSRSARARPGLRPVAGAERRSPARSPIRTSRR